jgi:hypothetical protein
MFAHTKMGVKDFFICSIASVIGLPLSFFLWYRSLYFAAQSDGSVWRYTKTFMYMLLQLAWAAIVIISPPFIGKLLVLVLALVPAVFFVVYMTTCLNDNLTVAVTLHFLVTMHRVHLPAGHPSLFSVMLHVPGCIACSLARASQSCFHVHLLGAS